MNESLEDLIDRVVETTREANERERAYHLALRHRDEAKARLDKVIARRVDAPPPPPRFTLTSEHVVE